MNCEEFLRQFRDALDGKVSEHVIQDNVDYYRSYINSQTAGGKSESDVLRMLGDPRLLARTIEESSKFAADQESRSGYKGSFSGGGRTYSDYTAYSYAESTDHDYTEASEEKHSRIPGWLVTCIVMAVVFLLLSFTFRVAIALAPYIIVFLLAVFAVRVVRSWWHTK